MNKLLGGDYYPFGMGMVGRETSTGEGYRFGFNGQEKSLEISKSGNSYTAEFWEYNPLIGRRWNVDPVRKDYESPYATFSNNPVMRVDPRGDSDTTYRTGSGNSIRVSDKATNITLANQEAYDPSNWNFSGLSKDTPPLTSERLKEILPPGVLIAFQDGKDYFKASLTINGKNQWVYEGFVNVNSGEAYKEPDVINPSVGKAFDIGGAFGTTTQGVSSGFLRGAKLARSAGGVGSVPIGIPSGLNAKSPNVFPLGRVSAGTALKVSKAAKIIDAASKGVTIAAGIVNIAKDGKLTAGDAGVAALTAAQLAFPVFGFAVGLYDIGSLIFGYKSSSDLVHDIIDSAVYGQNATNAYQDK